MSISFPAKATLGVLVGGATVAGGTLIYKEVSKSDVQSKEDKSKKSVLQLIKDLKKDKRLITSTEISNPDGKSAWEKYRKDNNAKDLDVGGVKGGSKESGDIVSKDTTQEFISACKDKGSYEIMDETDALFSQFVDYCTRDTLVSDLISETEGKSLLEKGKDFTTNKDGKIVGDSYKKSNEKLAKDEGDLGNWADKKSETEVPEEFVTKCLEKSKLKEHQFNKPNYLDVLKYCTKAG